jgi:hypothetical protein
VKVSRAASMFVVEILILIRENQRRKSISSILLKKFWMT